MWWHKSFAFVSDDLVSRIQIYRLQSTNRIDRKQAGNGLTKLACLRICIIGLIAVTLQLCLSKKELIPEYREQPSPKQHHIVAQSLKIPLLYRES